MRKIRDVLRYRHTTDVSLEAIAGALRLSKGVVAKYLKLASSAGLSWPLPDDQDDRTLERRLYPRPPAIRAAARVEPDYARVHQELKKKGVTLTLLWQEYRADIGAGAYLSRRHRARWESYCASAISNPWGLRPSWCFQHSSTNGYSTCLWCSAS